MAKWMFDIGIKRQELENFLGISVIDNDYGEFEVGNGVVFSVLNEDEKLAVAKRNVKKTISTMNPSFLSQMTGIDVEVFDDLAENNEAIAAIVEGTCGLDKLVLKAVEFDGWGHFIASNGEELVISDRHSAFRVN